MITFFPHYSSVLSNIWPQGLYHFEQNPFFYLFGLEPQSGKLCKNGRKMNFMGCLNCQKLKSKQTLHFFNKLGNTLQILET